jgi:hypothetical protein
MKEPFANLDASSIDEQIEQILFTEPTQQDDEDTRCLRDLHYLYRKEEILAHAQQRLMITSLAERTHTKEDQPADPGMPVWREQSTLSSRPLARFERGPFSWPKVAAGLVAAMLLIATIFGTAAFLNARSRPGPAGKGTHPGVTATPAISPAMATATAESSILFSDPLDQNIHNWPVDNEHFFKNGAYHLSNQSMNALAAVIPQLHFAELPPAVAYQITLREITGGDASPVNTFGLILRYTQTSGAEKFYAFEILNENGASKYRFYAYDNSKKSSNPWRIIWQAKTGREFHRGHGPNASNTVNVVADRTSFTFYVNGQRVGSASDASFRSGSVGMLVNLKGTEVAFSNLLITRA